MDNKLKLLLLLSTCVQVTWSAITATHRCEIVSGVTTSFKLTVRLSTGGDAAVTGLTFFDATDTDFTSALEAQTDVACITLTEAISEPDIYEISFTVDTTGALPCGIVQDGASNVYKLAYRADPEQAFAYGTCDLGNLMDTNVTSALFEPGNIQPPFLKYPLRNSLHMDALLEGGNDVPLSTEDLLLGRNMRLAVTYRRLMEDISRTQFGNIFHTGFLKNDVGTLGLSLQLMTCGPFGTRVQVTGTIGSAPINEIIYVAPGSLVTYDISSNYAPTSAFDGWLMETKGIKLESLDFPIAVMSESSSNAGWTRAFAVLPDTVLGQAYSLYTPTGSDTTGQAIIVATADSTTVDIAIGTGYTVPGGGLMVDGQAVNAVDLPKTVMLTMNEYDTFHLYCGNCKDIAVGADQDIAVVFGVEETGSDAPTMSQLPPDTTSGRSFVVLLPDHGSPHALTFGAASAFTATYAMTAGTPMTTSTDILIIPPAATFAMEVSVTSAVQMSYAINAAATYSYVIPSTSQWATHYSLHLFADTAYTVYIVSTVAGLSSVTDSVLGTVVGGSDVNYISASGPANYKWTTYDIAANSDYRLREFTSEYNKPFLVIPRETTGNANRGLPVGPRFPLLSPCIPSSTMAPAIPGLTIYDDMLPGDNLDNDCDGLVDEENADGTDTDGTGGIDEDLALAPLNEFADVHGVYVDELYACDTASCGNFKGQIISAGCNDAAAGSSPAAMGNFEKDADLVTSYPDYWGVKTSAFPAFRFTDETKIHFLALVKFCYDDGAVLCTNSCANRRRRDVTNTTVEERSEWVGLTLNIRDPDIEDRDAILLEHPCIDNVGYWVMVSALLVVIGIQVVAYIVIRTRLSAAQRPIEK